MAKTTKHAEFIKWIPLLLHALRALGGSAEARDTYDWIANAVKLPQEDREKRNKAGNNRFQNQIQWARQYLMWEGLIDGSKRGIWALTAQGAKTHLDEDQARQLVQKWVKIHSDRRRFTSKTPEFAEPVIESDSKEPGVSDELETPEEAEENELLLVLQSLPPDGFERLCKRLLHEYGLERVVVTGKSHDGGVDGMGILRLNPFVTMKVLFQCKKIRKAVSRAQVGDFRNAVMGRADKGIFMTTGWFSADAEKEANRDGVIPIELVDGERLVELFETKQIGLRRREIFEVDHTFFDQFR
jgi:restriction system protein